MKLIKKNTSLKSEIENNKYTLDLVNSWINNADTKISIACGLSSLVIAVIAFGAEAFLSNAAEDRGLNSCILLLCIIAAVIAGALFLLSLWFYFWALNPSLISGKSPMSKAKYSIFYKDISEFSNVDDYIKSVITATEDDFDKELLQEIYINSGICTKKMQRFKIGMWLSVVAIIFTVLASILFYFAIV